MAEVILESGYHRLRKTDHGYMLYNWHDVCIGTSLDQIGYWSPLEIDYTREYAHGLVIDVGANLGCFSLEYAKTADAVFAFEPQWSVYLCLCANLALNCIENVVAYPFALGSENGTAEMLALDYNRPSNLGGMWCFGAAQDTAMFENISWNPQGKEALKHPVPLRTLDSFELAPNFVKIDVEGYEEQVLAGMRETCQRARPVLYVENNTYFRSPAQVEALCALVEELGYRWVWHKVAYHQLDLSAPIVYGENMLCLPV